MQLDEVMTQLKEMGNEKQKHILINHGAQEPFYNVRISDMKKLIKKIKKDHKLSLELYNTGNSDAMYMAGQIADEKQITKEILNDWVKKAYWSYLSEYTVPFIAAESRFGMELALEWIESEDECICSAGWATLTSLAIIKEDENLDLKKYAELLERVGAKLQTSKNRVRYTMNGFVIAVGGSIIPLSKKAIEIAQSYGKVNVNMGNTACKVPSAVPYIEKMEKTGRMGYKKKKARY